jgi:hypothetical protein
MGGIVEACQTFALATTRQVPKIGNGGYGRA